MSRGRFRSLRWRCSVPGAVGGFCRSTVPSTGNRRPMVWFRLSTRCSMTDLLCLGSGLTVVWLPGVCWTLWRSPNCGTFPAVSTVRVVVAADESTAMDAGVPGAPVTAQVDGSRRDLGIGHRYRPLPELGRGRLDRPVFGAAERGACRRPVRTERRTMDTSTRAVVKKAAGSDRSRLLSHGWWAGRMVLILNTMWSQCPVPDENVANGWTIVGHGPRVIAVLFAVTLLTYLALDAIPWGWSSYLATAAASLTAVGSGDRRSLNGLHTGDVRRARQSVVSGRDAHMVAIPDTRPRPLSMREGRRCGCDS